MTELAHPSTLELLDVADIAVRAAGQLQRARDRRPLKDSDAIVRVLALLQKAEQGSKFLCTGQLASSPESLQPLNWAADIYQVDKAATEAFDYDGMARYLAEIVRSLKYARALSGSESIADNLPTPDIETSIQFLYRLSDSLAEEVGARESADVIELRG